MTRFSLEGDGDRNERVRPKIRVSTKRRRMTEGTSRGSDITYSSRFLDSSDDEGHEEPPPEPPKFDSTPNSDGNGEQSIETPPLDFLFNVRAGESGSSSRNGSGPVPLFLTDPDLLDCPICFEPLSSPVYQCDNGHLGCALCCEMMNKKCGSCSFPIGYNRCRAIEKMLESIRMSCKNEQHGCTELLTYRKKLDHDKLCEFVPCKCPYPNCTYTGASNSLYAHFPTHRSRSYVKFKFNFGLIVPIRFDRVRENLAYLQERAEKTLFVLNMEILETSFSLCLVCISPDLPDKKFSYSLKVSDEESSIELKTNVECTTDRSLHGHVSKYLCVPDDFLNDCAPLKLEVVIRKRQ